MKIFVVTALVIMLSASFFLPEASATPRGKSPAMDIKATLKSSCPVDGKAVDPSSPYKVDMGGGKVVSFCSQECKNKFMADPGRYSSNIR